MSTKAYVPQLWPRHKFNIIDGASGAGKSRWILPQLYALMDGLPIMGHPTEPTKVAYICCDRPKDDAQSTIELLGLDPNRLPIFSFMDNELEWSFNNVINFIPPGTQLTFIEAVGALVPGANLIDYHNILRLGRLIHKTRRTTGSDFWGSTHTPKLKKGEEYKHTRDNVLGSSAWPGIAGTIVHIEDPGQDTNQRDIHVLTRDDPPYVLEYEFDTTGHLVERGQAVGAAILDLWLKQCLPSTVIRTSQILERASKAAIKERTAYRWVNQQVTDGTLDQAGKGIYTVRPKN